MKYIGILALTGLAACSVSYDQFLYEVTEKSAEEVRIQTHQGMLSMEPDEVRKGLAHMEAKAAAVCQEFGRGRAVYRSERTYTTGAYYSWVERAYSCV